MGRGLLAPEIVVAFGLHLAGCKLRHGAFTQPLLAVLPQAHVGELFLPRRLRKMLEVNHHAPSAHFVIGNQLLLHGLRGQRFETQPLLIGAFHQRRYIGHVVGDNNGNLLFVFEHGAEHDGTVEISPQRGVARNRFRVQRLSQYEAHLVARTPLAVYGDIASRLGLLFHRPAVYRQFVTLGRPFGVTQIQHEPLRPGHFDAQPHLVRTGKVGKLFNLHPARFPVERRRDIKIDIQVFARVGKVDEFAVTGVILHTGADAAPERIEGQAESLAVSRPHRRHIAHHSVVGILRCENLVVKRPLVIIGPPDRRIELIQVLGQLEHVVGIAGLAGSVRKPVCQHARCAEMLVFAVAADRIAVESDHAVPEIVGDTPVTLIPGTLVLTDGADDLRYLRIGMLARQRIHPGGQRTQNLAVVETSCKLQVFTLPRQDIDVGQRFRDSAVFANQDFVHLFVRKLRHQSVEPVGKAHQHGQSLGIGRIAADIDQPGIHFMQGVERHPAAVKVESLRADIAPLQLGEERAAAFEPGQQSRSLLLLTLGKAVDRVIDLIEQRPIAGRGVHHRGRRQKMPEPVARTSGALPAAVAGRFGFEPRLGAEARKVTVGVHRIEPATVHLLRMQKRTARNAHVVQRNGITLRLHRRMSLAGPGHGRRNRDRTGTQHHGRQQHIQGKRSPIHIKQFLGLEFVSKFRLF